MSDSEFEMVLACLSDSNELIRENTCESVQAGDDLRLVEYLIRILEDDPSDSVRFDANKALIRLCFARPVCQPDNLIATWWRCWWSRHFNLVSEHLLSQCIARYLHYVHNKDDEAMEEEITLGLAFDFDPGWPTLYKTGRLYIAYALFDTLVDNHVPLVGSIEAMAARLLPFACNLLRRARQLRQE